MINDDAGISWNGEAYFYPYMHDYPRHPYCPTPMSHREKIRSDRYTLRGRHSNQSSIPASHGHSLDSEYERLYHPAVMMMSEDPPVTSQDMRMVCGNEDCADRSDAVASAAASRGVKRERDPSFNPPRIGEAMIHALEPSFSSSSDNQCIDSSETTAKRGRHIFQQDHHLARAAGYQDDSHYLSEPYSMSLSDPEFMGMNHWMEQPLASSDAFGPTIYPHWNTSPIELTLRAQPLRMALTTQSRKDESPDEDDRKPAAEQEASEAFLAPAVAAPAKLQVDSPAASSSETSGGERSSDSSQREPSTREIESCNNIRSREALVVWYQRLSELVDFKAHHGHTHVRQKYKANPPLGIWVNKQRCTRHNLTPEKVKALEGIDFDWGKRKGQHAWNQKFAMLEALSTY